jgi:hypothetical protein
LGVAGAKHLAALLAVFASSDISGTYELGTLISSIKIVLVSVKFVFVLTNAFKNINTR